MALKDTIETEGVSQKRGSYWARLGMAGKIIIISCLVLVAIIVASLLTPVGQSAGTPPKDLIDKTEEQTKAPETSEVGSTEESGTYEFSKVENGMSFEMKRKSFSESNGNYTAIYDVKIENEGDKKINSWNMKIEFDKSASVVFVKNCTVKSDKAGITINPTKDNYSLDIETQHDDLQIVLMFSAEEYKIRNIEFEVN